MKKETKTTITETRTVTTTVRDDSAECNCCCNCLYGGCYEESLEKYNRQYREVEESLNGREKRAGDNQYDLDEVAWLRHRLNIEYKRITGYWYAFKDGSVRIITNEVIVEQHSNEETVATKLSLQESIFEMRLKSAKRGIFKNSIFGVIFAIILLGGLGIIIMESLFPGIMNPGGGEMRQVVTMLTSLGGFLAIVVGGMFALFFFGHLVQCVRDAKDPTRSNAEDEKI